MKSHMARVKIDLSELCCLIGTTQDCTLQRHSSNLEAIWQHQQRTIRLMQCLVYDIALLPAIKIEFSTAVNKVRSR